MATRERAGRTNDESKPEQSDALSPAPSPVLTNSDLLLAERFHRYELHDRPHEQEKEPDQSGVRLRISRCHAPIDRSPKIKPNADAMLNC